MPRIAAQASLTLLLGIFAGGCPRPLQDHPPLAADGGEDAGPAEPDAARPGERDAPRPPELDAAIVADPAAPPDGGDTPIDDDRPNRGDDVSTPAETPDAGVPQVYGITSRGRLVTVEPESGAIERAITITGIGDGERVLGGDIRPANGKLYLLTDRAQLYEIALDTGAAAPATSLVADAKDATAPFTALGGKRFGVDWNPVADRLRVVSDAGENLRIDPATGATTTDGAIGPGARMLTSAAYTQNFGSACRTRLLVIDSGSRRLLLQDPPNAGTLGDIGSLGDDPFDEVSTFDIQTALDGSDRGLVAVAQAGRTRLLDVDLRSGAASKPRSLALEAGESLIALATTPPRSAPQQKPGELLGLTESQRLISFNRSAPGKLCTSNDITGLDPDERLLGLDVRPTDGALYALGGAGTLYTIAVPSGAATLAARLTADPADATDPFRALSGNAFGVGWNPVADRLRVISDGGQNLRIQASGAVTTDAALSGSVSGAAALAYTNAFAGTKSTTLFAVDPSQIALVRVGGDPATTAACTPMLDPGNPNCGLTSLIGAFGAGTAVNGFEIDGKTGAAFAALAVGPATVSTLYSVDLARGVASQPAGVANATIGGGELLRGLTLAAVPAARGFGLTSDGTLLVFGLTAPSQPSATLPISGMSPGERVLGIDVRPADGRLYALGSAGRLYTLDPQSGAAALVTSLAAASGDDQPFAGFGAMAHGVDFNPAADLLRVVDVDGQNLRVVPSARADLRLGDAYTDAQLTPGAPAVIAAAYSDNYAASPWTTLYVIDSELDSLCLQGGTQGTPSPNGGTLTPLGKLGVDATGEAGFDIAGGHNGLSVAALATSGERSSLYSIDLIAGWATPFNASANQIGSDGAWTLIGFAIELK